MRELDEWEIDAVAGGDVEWGDWSINCCSIGPVSINVFTYTWDSSSAGGLGGLISMPGFGSRLWDSMNYHVNSY